MHTHFNCRPGQGPHRPWRTAHASNAIRRRSLAKRLHPRAQPLCLLTRHAPPRILPPLLQLLPPQDVAQRLGVRGRARGRAFPHVGAEARGRDSAYSHDVGAPSGGGC